MKLLNILRIILVVAIAEADRRYTQGWVGSASLGFCLMILISKDFYKWLERGIRKVFKK